MSRRSNNTKEKPLKTNIQEPCNSWVFLLKGNLIEGPNSENTIVTLRHPCTGEAAIFLLSNVDYSIHEILTYSEEKRSWFIDDAVKSDGSFKISAPIDPIFLALPYLIQNAKNQAVPLDQILHDDKYPAIQRLLDCDGLKYLTSVADKKVCQEIIAYKYNEEKTLQWLEKKTNNVARKLKEKNIHMSSDATSSMFRKVENIECDFNVFLRYASGIIADYLREDLHEKLVKLLNFPEIVPSAKRKSDVLDLHELKRIKSEEVMSPIVKNGILKNKLGKVGNSNAKSKIKPAKNTRSIASFFK